MKRLKVSGVCLNQTPLDFEGNLKRVREGLRQARAAEATLICFPELCLTGYGCEDAFFREDTTQKALDSLMELVPDSIGLAFCVGLPLIFEGQLYNVSAFVADGKILGFTPKSKLPGTGIYYEPRWFKPWPGDRVGEIEIHGLKIPIGLQLYALGDIRVAIEICEDAWAADRPGLKYYQHGVDIILNPSASDFSLGKSVIRQQLVCDASRAFECSYVYANLLGNEAGRIIYDGEILIASSGNLLARNNRFSYRDTGIQIAVLDLQHSRNRRKKIFHHPPCQAEMSCVHAQDDYPFQCSEPPSDKISESSVIEATEWEFSKAVPLALFDYLRKTHSQGYVISLSGGADSSACAVLSAASIWNALDELGMDLLLEKLRHIQLNTHAPLESQLITCIYQTTENNSIETLESAESLAKGLGVEFHLWDINPLVRSYTHLVESALGKTLTWTQDNLAMQNIQARTRVPALWMIANVKNALLLTTSNRSESSVGYVTMDGDSSGGLAPLAGIDKVFIRRWLLWAEKHLEIPELASVNQLNPSAELKPSGESQTDERDLMPYEILNFIERLWVHENKSTAEIHLLTAEKFPEYPTQEYVQKYIRLFNRNQWKRERIAPSFHVDTYNLDPRSGFRYPIINGEDSSTPEA